MSIDPNLDPIDSEDDLFEHFNFVVDKGQQLLRIDKYLLLKISNASRSKIQVGIEAGSVKVNNLSIKLIKLLKSILMMKQIKICK